MGNVCCKKKKSYQDFTETDQQETYNITRLTQYGTLTAEEKKMLYLIDQVKARRDYRNLVFEGGGVKGVAHCGGLIVLEEMGILQKIQKFAGSSAGAILAAFAALGYSAKDISGIVYNTNFEDFITNGIFPFGKMESMLNLTKDMGCNNGNEFEAFIEKWIKYKTGKGNYTFLDLYKDRQKTLVITGTDINRELTMYFNHESHPHMPIKEAVRISMSIPVLFQPVQHHGDLYVDGGLFDNYPIHVFDGAFPGDPQAVNNLIPINPHTLGFKLMKDNDLPNMSITKREDVSGLKSYIVKLTEALYDSNTRHYMRPSYWNRSVIIKVPNIPLTQFYQSIPDKNRMLANGTIGCTTYFK